MSSKLLQRCLSHRGLQRMSPPTECLPPSGVMCYCASAPTRARTFPARSLPICANRRSRLWRSGRARPSTHSHHATRISWIGASPASGHCSRTRIRRSRRSARPRSSRPARPRVPRRDAPRLGCRRPPSRPERRARPRQRRQARVPALRTRRPSRRPSPSCSSFSTPRAMPPRSARMTTG